METREVPIFQYKYLKTSNLAHYLLAKNVKMSQE